MIHILKTHARFFKAVWEHRKRFELRRDDRSPPFGVYDYLDLQEVDDSFVPPRPTGRWCRVQVLYVARDLPAHFGLSPGFCILSITHPLETWVVPAGERP